MICKGALSLSAAGKRVLSYCSTTDLQQPAAALWHHHHRTTAGLLRSIDNISNHAWSLNQVRHKTFRKNPTKAYTKRKIWIKQLKAEGKPIPEQTFPVMENKFWRVVGKMKIYKSVSPGSTNRRHATRFHLHKGSCVWRLSYGKRSTGGRNNTGRITVRHRGGGHKKRVRQVDFNRNVPGSFEVVRLEYDPNRSAELCLLRHLSTNEFSYIIRPAGVDPGQILYSYRSGIPVSTDPNVPSISKSELIQPGNCLHLKDIPVGTLIHCIGLHSNGPAQLCRSAGTSGQLISTPIATLSSTVANSNDDLPQPVQYAQVRLSSGEVRLIPADVCATIGVVGNELHMHRNWGKAGARRRKGWRPAVRGIAMSAHKHPHGGGHKSKGNKAPRSPWGWKTKGYKTVRRKRWFVVTPKWKAKK
ncbi:hypothetical protein BATDEDRAFT_37159 [Batrachochytrium dendrobatidis JAM81]|uniref:Uncharacterized protein n=2 Tax=Batrachochytrium dendrobatidis TaxID=109871 RepID=F4P6G4_BATDJ|nr:mitochondrial 54S ribosomal protein RML2 [Batrachochytrium dendrobatidis JAM81]EGF79345.1 hypothetical protein BATDEDRAFT_37159 [Batrachochytrium dendrobatidis JAM81]KAJ8323085.1 mitochondrial 54S ribosomal protein rml2 [Batrachochytrium dendrobatidis]KAK5665599.1 mitochondrial 54S ribosomal protein rml2 [Batrachochytrium dendrobatidis]OAJ42522.1 ribosomal protein L2 [Batrachochytrium dendrobatidis JEL423]|eukprot:XP_006680032.1 hypothetical protein BATDEDRAFT_37159 [Batrachochytrium dendrobatidis JAM81]